MKLTHWFDGTGMQHRVRVVAVDTSMGGTQASRIPADHDRTVDDSEHNVGVRDSSLASERADVRDLSCIVRRVPVSSTLPSEARSVRTTQ